MNFTYQNNVRFLVNKQRVDLFLKSKRGYFPEEKFVFLKEKLYSMEESKFSLLSEVELKNPKKFHLASIFLGFYGIDRFMLKEIGRGFFKLFTAGGIGLLYMSDCFTIKNKVKEMNYNNVISLLINLL